MDRNWTNNFVHRVINKKDVHNDLIIVNVDFMKYFYFTSKYDKNL